MHCTAVAHTRPDGGNHTARELCWARQWAPTIGAMLGMLPKPGSCPDLLLAVLQLRSCTGVSNSSTACGEPRSHTRLSGKSPAAEQPREIMEATLGLALAAVQPSGTYWTQWLLLESPGATVGLARERGGGGMRFPPQVLQTPFVYILYTISGMG